MQKAIFIVLILVVILPAYCYPAATRPQAVEGGILFTFDSPDAQQVYIAGEFNGWSPNRDAMEKDESGTWRIILPLKPGRYEYKFVVDGITWFHDPHNPLYVPDPYGGKNSVVVILADGTLDFTSLAGSVSPIAPNLKPYSKPLYLAILWHQHQPRYQKDLETGEYLEPWVRIHSIKDYYDMAAILEDYPGMKFTINLTPVLISQIEEIVSSYDRYVNSGGSGYMRGCDRWMRLTLTPPESLSVEEKIYILENFFRMPKETMIDIYPRFSELASKKLGDTREAIISSLKNFSDQDLRDLQMWFNLAEFDPDFREGQVRLPDGTTVSVKEFIDKGRKFTEQDKWRMMRAQIDIMRNIIAIHRKMQDKGQLEVITSPYYHPILPLLCNTDVARVSSPTVALPDPAFSYCEDVSAQVELAVELYRRVFNRDLKGMWPSEGAVSEDIIPILCKNGIEWVATDEEVLARSLGKVSLAPYEKYKAYQIEKDGCRLGVIFRDRSLSDDIGFRYSKRNGTEAANDMISKLYEIHKAIQQYEGNYVVAIILDGENAWEHYEHDGKDFLRSFYSQVCQSQWLIPITISEAFEIFNGGVHLSRLAPGSWIGARFDTWIGEREENVAWQYLKRARELVESKRSSISQELLRRVLSKIYIAEGSDWFWWYGLDQNSGKDEVFDEAFRSTLAEVYTLLGEEVPQYLLVPIVTPSVTRPSTVIRGEVSPQIDGSLTTPEEWSKAAYLKDEAFQTMATAEDLISGFFYGYDNENLYLRVDGVLWQGVPEGHLYVCISGGGMKELNAGLGAKGCGGLTLSNLGIAYLVEVLYRDGLQEAILLSADGRGGWHEEGSVVAHYDRFLEVSIPFSKLGVSMGEDLKLVIAACRDNAYDACPDQGGLVLKVPPTGQIEHLLHLDDPVGDDKGPGTYTYPTDPIFVPGAFDVTSVDIMRDEQKNLIFRLRVRDGIVSTWGGITGFCLQAVDIYIDTDGIKGSGNTRLFKGRKAMTAPDNAWEIFVRASMDTVAIYDQRGRRLDEFSVRSYGDAASSSIYVIFPQSVLGDVDQCHLIVALLGHDGYSEGGIRPVSWQSEQWVFGGCEDTYACPNILDLVVEPGYSQQEILSSYKRTHQLVEIPGFKLDLK